MRTALAGMVNGVSSSPLLQFIVAPGNRVKGAVTFPPKFSVALLTTVSGPDKVPYKFNTPVTALVLVPPSEAPLRVRLVIAPP